MKRRITNQHPSAPSSAPVPVPAATPALAAASSPRLTYRQLLGRAAEDRAADFLRAQGFQILARNFRRRRGELDLIAQRGELLVIAEVRYRTTATFGGAAASVDGRKQVRLIRAATQLLQQQPALRRLRVRFDVITVEGNDAKIEWIQHAFST